MAFEIKHYDFYQCLSTDTKLTAGIKAGSKLEELDTGLKYAFDGTTWKPDILQTSITGSLANRRGLAVNKPLATAVDVGTTYWSVDTDPHANSVEVSNGTNWVVI